MSHKCLDKELDGGMEYSHHHGDDETDAMFSDECGRKQDYIKLGQWILLLQDGMIDEADFHKLEYCLQTDRRAMEYYFEFMWICAGLHMMFNKQLLSSITASLPPV